MAVNYTIEIDIDKAEQQLGKLTSDFMSAFNSGKVFKGTSAELNLMIENAQKKLKGLTAQYDKLLENFTKTGKGENALKITEQQISETEAALQALKKTLAEMPALDLSEKFNAGKTFSGNNLQLKQRIAEVRAELQALKQQYKETEQELANKNIVAAPALEKISNVIKETEAELQGLQRNWQERRLSSENIFQGIAQGAQGLMGAFTAAQGAAALLGAEEEKLQKVQTKLQASMSILMGLQRAGNLLNSTSQFRVQVLNKLMESYHKWNLKVAASEGIKKAAMAGLVGIIAAAVAGLTALIIKYSKYSEEVKKAKELQKAFKNEMANSLTSQLGTLIKLEAEWKATNGDLEEQRALIARNKSEFESLGFAVNTVKDAENVLVTNKDAVVKSLEDRAKAAAYLARVNTLVAESAELAAQMETKRKNGGYDPNWFQRQWGDFVGIGSVIKNNSTTTEGVINDFVSAKQRYLDKVTTRNEEKDEQKKKELDEKLKAAEEDYIQTLTGGTQLDNYNFQKQQTQLRQAIENAFRQRLDVIERNAREERNKTVELRQQIQDAELAAMEDGYAKEQKTRDYANEREIESIRKAKEEYVLAAKERAKAVFDADEALKKARNQEYVTKVFDPDSVSVDTTIFDQLEAVTRQKQYATNLRRILDENADFVREFNKLWEDFNGKNQELFLASFDMSPEEFERAQNKLLKVQEDKVAAFAKNLAESYEDADFTNWYKSIQKMNYRDLEAQLGAAEKKFNELAGAEGTTEEEMVRLQSAIAILKRMLRDFTEDEQKDVADGFKDWSNAIELTRNIFESAAEQIGGTAGEIAKAIGNSLAQIQSVGNSLNVLNSASASSADKLAAKMNLASTALSGMIQLVGMYVNSLEEARKAEKEWQMTLRESEHRLAMLHLAELDYQKDNIFGVENPYARAISGAKQYAAAIEELNDMQARWYEGQIQIDTKKAVDWKNVLSGAGTGAAAGAALGTAIGGWAMGAGTVIGTVVGGLVGAITGLFSRKVEPVFESLASHYGELYDENYILNQQLVADYDKLDDATKQIVDNWDEIVDKMKEAEEQMRENFHDLAGDLGDSLSDRLVEAFRGGKVNDAMKAFKGDVTEMMESIIQQQVFSTLFGDLYESLENEMMSSFKLGGDQNLIDDIMRFDTAWQDRIGAYGDAMKQIQDYYKSQGYDLWSEDKTRTAATKAITGVSQDSFNEMSGRVTSIQLSAYNIDETTKMMREQQTNLLAITASILNEVMGIHQDTERMQQSLDTMQGDLTLVRSNVTTMTDKGVRMLN